MDVMMCMTFDTKIDFIYSFHRINLFLPWLIYEEEDEWRQRLEKCIYKGFLVQVKFIRLNFIILGCYYPSSSIMVPTPKIEYKN